MKLKSKPSKPKRKINTWTYSVHDDMKLTAALKHFEKIAEQDDTKFHPDDVYFTVYSCWEDGTEVYIAVDMPESETTYNQRMEKYEKRLADYEQWYEDNEEEIKAEIAKRKKVIEQKIQLELIRARDKAERELAKLQKKLGE